jgi:hypothetical protein
MIIKKQKRAQLKIQQMVFVLLAVTLFFVLVGMFVLNYKLSGLKNQATLLKEEDAMQIVSKLANSPEFSCGESFGSLVNCIDADKVMVLKDNIGDYKDFWGVKNLELRKIYPAISGEVECNKANYPDCNIIKVYNIAGGIEVSNFVTLCTKQSADSRVYDKCEVARLYVSYDKVT